MSQSDHENQLTKTEYLRLKRVEEFVKTGFSTQSQWQDASAIYTEGKLLINGYLVMEDWETPYMKELARVATSNQGVVLEVGFGLGISATYVQAYPIEKHIVIEANADVFKKLQELALLAERKVEPLFGFWQDVISAIPDQSVDGILFDTYPLNEEEGRYPYAIPFFESAYRVLKKGGIFTYFSAEVNDFSPYHLEKLKAAGFNNIQKKVLSVSPPKDCPAWGDDTIVVPIIIKS
ncbi:class I SAM-dependent methyltransferase [Lyngbya sp. CCAP 1446/10]|uniref:class I SAM-dependent methyltransferase n=1 Tax=Lyngbya sp. CCAP 1446/10 TaxID=439293 RepID=UPI0022376CB1|nr:class I SAM-dependent methyltransferase [Lyngbya sp. CCAP 1446/10]MCW6052943.1 class I SAM-dependent methyltransferase [Lyngbya sp. CCAP 1446/10]